MGLDDLLAQLAPADRHIIELNVFHEMNAKEVANAFGITPGNARVRLSRALARLRTIRLEQAAGREEKHSHE
jgi:RNA polymerase sigma factor (sigma-70 family)